MSDWKGTEYEKGLFNGQCLIISDALGNMHQFCNKDTLCVLDEVLGRLEQFAVSTVMFGFPFASSENILADLHALRAKVCKVREGE